MIQPQRVRDVISAASARVFELDVPNGIGRDNLGATGCLSSPAALGALSRYLN